MIIFKKAGPDNTDKALTIAYEAAQTRGISQIVVASTRGETALAALRLQNKSAAKLLVVTHNNYFNNQEPQQFSASVRSQVEASGGTVFTGSLVTRAIGRALRNVMGYSQEEIVSMSLRMICQGVKVCCEMSAMACDAGLLTAKQACVCVAGTGWGADTVCIMEPNSSNNFFDIRVKEILAKPL